MNDDTDGYRFPIYQIGIQGNLDEGWADWFDKMEIYIQDSPNGIAITILTGPVTDQAELRGMLNRLWDLNLTLISVTRLEPARRKA